MYSSQLLHNVLFSDGLFILFTSPECPQWNELGRKLTKLIMFRRNNMPGEEINLQLSFWLLLLAVFWYLLNGLKTCIFVLINEL